MTAQKKIPQHPPVKRVGAIHELPLGLPGSRFLRKSPFIVTNLGQRGLNHTPARAGRSDVSISSSVAKARVEPTTRGF